MCIISQTNFGKIFFFSFSSSDANIIYGYSIKKRQSKKVDSKKETSIDDEEEDISQVDTNEVIQRQRVRKQKVKILKKSTCFRNSAHIQMNISYLFNQSVTENSYSPKLWKDDAWNVYGKPNINRYDFGNVSNQWTGGIPRT